MHCVASANVLASKFVVSDEAMKIFGECRFTDAKGRQRKIMGVGTLSDETPLKIFDMEGSLSFKNFSCDTIKISGECFGESLKAKNFSIDGTLKVNAVSVSQAFKLYGSLNVDNLTAEKIFIRSRSGSVDKIKCQQIKIFDDNFTDTDNLRIRGCW